MQRLRSHQKNKQVNRVVCKCLFGLPPSCYIKPGQISFLALIPTVNIAEAAGWPFSYFGQNVDERVKPQHPEKGAQAIKPDYALGPHTASLGLTAAEGNTLPEQFQKGMFVGQHGSWNRKPRSGYKVIFVPFADGEPDGQPVDMLRD